jgi:signal transduction histidine kinase
MNKPLADAELAQLLSLAAHEIRNPVSPIVGFIKMVMRDKNHEISTQQRQWLDIALNSCGRLRDLGDQLSEYARMVKGEVTLNRTAIDLGLLIRESIAALSIDAERPVVIEQSGESAGVINGDRALLKRAFTTIIGALRLEVGLAAKLLVQIGDADYSGKPATWVLIGDPDQLAVLGEAKKAPGWFDDKERGNLGVTLWIAKWIVQAHGGRLAAPESAAKGGGGLVVLPHA